MVTPTISSRLPWHDAFGLDGIDALTSATPNDMAPGLRALAGLVHGVGWSLRGTAEAEDHAAEDSEGCEELKRRDGAGAGQCDGGQCGDGDQPVEQSGAVYPEAFHGRVPGEEHDDGDRCREV